MGGLASLDIAAIGAALLWPLAAGVLLVLWSKARAAAQAHRAAKLDERLQGLYSTLESRPVPPSLAMVVEALEEGEELAGHGSRTKAASTTGA